MSLLYRRIRSVLLLQAAQLEDLKALVEQVEATSPLHAPTEHIELLAGKWQLLFSTIKVTVSPASTAS